MKVLIITAHPDDMEMSMGGTVKKLIDNGDQVDNIIMCTDTQKKLINKKFVVVNDRQEAIDKSTKILGHNSIFYNNSLGTTSPGHCGATTRPQISNALVREFENLYNLSNYDLLVTHWHEDWHQDHKMCYDLVNILKRNQPINVMYMDAFPYNAKYKEFEANIFYDITNQWQAKEECIKAFTHLDTNWVERIKAYNYYRGSYVKKGFAECFKIDTMLM